MAKLSDESEKAKYLEDHCVGQRNVIYKLYVFDSRQQGEQGPVQEYSAALRKQAALRDLGNLTPGETLRDRTVCGLHDERERQIACYRAETEPVTNKQRSVKA